VDHNRFASICLALITAAAGASRAAAQVDPSTFVNWENHPIHSLELTRDGTLLLLLNSPDNHLELFDLTGALPHRTASIAVGLDPVSVRISDGGRAWIVNHISDSISIVDLATRHVVHTIRTADEPFDVAFAGNPPRAFVTCSQANLVQVFDADNYSLVSAIPIDGEDPRALAVSPDRQTVYAAIWESGNASTVLGGGINLPAGIIAYPPNVVDDPLGPYGGVNPPPNDGAAFNPPISAGNMPPPKVSLIVRKQSDGRWLDDNIGDWTDLVSGANAARSGRLTGWDLPDHDLAVIDANTLSASYVTGMMNILMSLAVNPASGRIYAIGTDATNEVRYEPVLSGRFLRVNVAIHDPAAPGASEIHDLNPHLDYATATLPQSQRDRSIGDPRGIVWNAAGTRAYITGMGSNNVVVIDADGQRAGLHETIDVGEGPIGVALDELRARLYVHNRFEGSLSVIDTQQEVEIARVAFFDPTPMVIKTGRRHLYDTHKTSGLGHIACASCHVDARMDRLAWDLGNPQGAFVSIAGQNLGAGIPGLTPATANPPFQDFHPMKGPTVTQTLQDIIGKEPLHWRGDRDGLEEFNPAFEGLQGDDVQLTSVEMQEYEDFLATITFPPNPFRLLTNQLPTSLPLPGHFTPGRFAAAGQPLPNGDAVEGRKLYTNTSRRIDGGAFACVTCHTLPVGAGTDHRLQGGQFVPIAVGPLGEHHLQLVSVDGTTNRTIKTPQLRNLYEKVGFEATQPSNRSGFGFLHDGSIDSLARFVAEPAFNVRDDQEIANLVAFLLCFSGSDLPAGSPTNPLNPPGVFSKDTHALVGRQVTLIAPPAPGSEDAELMATLFAEANLDRVGLVARVRIGGEVRGYRLESGTAQFQSDRAAETISQPDLISLAAEDSELTLTAVPIGTETRIGIDRDGDGYYDQDERDACSDPADSLSVPLPGGGLAGDVNGDRVVDTHDVDVLVDAWYSVLGEPEYNAAADLNGDGVIDNADLQGVLNNWAATCP
jgi:YVTN family beta-propeller protein